MPRNLGRARGQGRRAVQFGQAGRIGHNLGAKQTAQIAPGFTGSLVLELFNQLNRDVDPASIVACVDQIVELSGKTGPTGPTGQIDTTGQTDQLVDLFVLCFQTRDCRGGKGERALFRSLFIGLHRHFAEQTIGMLDLIVQYGYFKDFVLLYHDALEHNLADLADALVSCMAKHLRSDQQALRDNSQLSLSAKYAPRIVKKAKSASSAQPAQPAQPAEPFGLAFVQAMDQSVDQTGQKTGSAAKSGSQPSQPTKMHAARQAFARQLRDCLFEHQKDASKQYRQLLSSLNEKLRTTERLMSQKRFSEIDPSCVPSQCLKRNRRAMLFVNKDGDLRDPANEQRMALREKVLYLAAQPADSAKKLKGAQLMAHQLVEECLAGSLPDDQRLVIEAQWQSLLAATSKQIDEFGKIGQPDPDPDQPDQPSLDLRNTVAMVDVSGSMTGTPMNVAIALGLVVSQLAAPHLRDRILTFSSAPAWHIVQPGDLYAKVTSLSQAHWSMSTNFAAAMHLIGQTILQVGLSSKQMPSIPQLIVFSDMQFDQACIGSWDTAYEAIVLQFADLGVLLRQHGVANVPAKLDPPIMTFWNLAADTTGMVVQANQKGVRCISGFSQSMLKLVLAGKLPASQIITPLTTLRDALDDPRYDAVRLALAGPIGASSKYFAGYKFQPSVDSADSVDSAASAFKVGSASHLGHPASCGGGGGGGGGADDGADQW